MAAQCRLCKERDRTIAAQAETIAALTELVNLQRALPTLQAPPEPERVTATDTGKSHLELLPEQPDEDEIMARLRAGVDDTDVADRLLAQLQVIRPGE